MKAYKVFNSDMTCRDYKYEVGKTYTHDGEIGICEAGFHACLKAVDCFNYYSFDSENVVCEVELLGEVKHGDDKSVCSEIVIVKQLNWNDVLSVVNVGKKNSGHRNSGDRNSGDSNSGDWNSGHSNSGDSNSGDRNSGHLNSGYRNSGDRNSGDWNSGDRNSGDFNTDRQDKKRMFNKWFLVEETESVYYPDFLYFDLTKFVSHDVASVKEKKEHKEDIEACGGFLKTVGYKEAFKLSWDNADHDDRVKIKEIPGFDADLFFEISGIKVDE